MLHQESDLAEMSRLTDVLKLAVLHREFREADRVQKLIECLTAVMLSKASSQIHVLLFLYGINIYPLLVT